MQDDNRMLKCYWVFIFWTIYSKPLILLRASDALPMLSDAQIPFYIVFHFGETLQVDQHEKLPEWSVYDVLFSDGFTR